MSAPKKVLFIGHDGSRTGAPLLLLEIVKWLCSHSSIQASILLKRGGELESEYQAIAPTRVLATWLAKERKRFYRRVTRKLGISSLQQPSLAALYPVEEYPVIYANTIDTLDLASQLAGPGRRIIHHIHELSWVIDKYFDITEKFKKAVASTDFYIAVSQSVRDYLETEISVPSAKIHLIHGFPLATAHPGGQSRESLRRQLGIPNDAFVVGMCGLPQWRKGSDLFVQLALHLTRQAGPGKCHLVWLGGAPSDQGQAIHDIAQLGLSNVCHFQTAVADPNSYFSVFDVFALTSREDPFSLAMLEAAASGLPIICFAGSGGGPELVEDDAGTIVPYLDVPAMATACVELWLDPARRLRLGQQAQAKVRSRYSLASQGPKILKIVEAGLGQKV